MIQPAIDVAGVTKAFGKGANKFYALRGVDFRVDPGELVMIVGPSGSGKTTLLSLIGCVLTPTSGTIDLFGVRVSECRESELPRLRLSNIGFVFQGHNLIASLSAAENVAFPLQMRGVSVREARRRADGLLERVGLMDKRDSLPSELSGGQRQRVAIARAIAGHPPLILADEPTASLDAQTGVVVSDLLRELAKERGHTVVVVTHDSRIFHVADRVVHIEDGQILRRAA